MATELVAEPQGSYSEPSPRDWASDWRSLTTLWGLPAAAMVVASFLGPQPRAVIWTGMLLWMGGTCLVNARRCSRTHCYLTGPFFLLIATAVVAYSSGVLALGADGWGLLGVITVVGAIGLWWVSELVWGRFIR